MNVSYWKAVATSVQMFVILCMAATTVFGQEKPAIEKLTETDLAYCKANDLEKYATASEKWKAEARKLSQSNATQGSAETILCLGSSSFRLWDSIDEDLAPYRMLRRAYGGAKYCDLAIHAPQLVEGLEFKAALIFVGNDITGNQLDKTPEEIARLSKLVMDAVRRQKPEAPIFLVAVTPTPSRFKHWPRILHANAALEELAKSQPKTYFIRSDREYLVSGEPRPELFVKDMLHQNSTGYQLWASIIRKSLDEHLK